MTGLCDEMIYKKKHSVKVVEDKSQNERCQGNIKPFWTKNVHILTINCVEKQTQFSIKTHL